MIVSNVKLSQIWLPSYKHSILNASVKVSMYPTCMKNGPWVVTAQYEEKSPSYFILNDGSYYLETTANGRRIPN